KTGQVVGVCGQGVGKQLEGNLSLEASVRRPIDLPHPALADPAGDGVVSQSAADHGSSPGRARSDTSKTVADDQRGDSSPTSIWLRVLSRKRGRACLSRLQCRALTNLLRPLEAASIPICQIPWTWVRRGLRTCHPAVSQPRQLPPGRIALLHPGKN